MKRRRNILRRAKGYMWGRKSKIKLAKIAVFKAGKYAYRDRRARKRDFRGLWNLKINAALRERGLTYSRFIHALKTSKIELDRKILADFAVHHPKLFEAIIAHAAKK
ncbi:50S ribosomal protein L20 [Candidatus Uhrbacteria bacterium]|nr:50S ribosomal protein L20 [Candidatus Uhrbacteria bacterium]